VAKLGGKVSKLAKMATSGGDLEGDDPTAVIHLEAWRRWA